MSGVNRMQRLIRIEFPLAFPHIMLVINQTVVFALFMVIIGTMIGTDDLGQFILKALSDKHGIGNGLMLVSRTRFPWTQNWLNRSVQGGPEHDRQF